jgi:hypothetical protein
VLQIMTKTSEKSLAEEFRNIFVLMNKHRAFFDRTGQFDFCVRWLHAKQAWLEGRLFRFARTMTSLAFSHPILTVSRLVPAVPNLGHNRALSRFHLRGGGMGCLHLW